ncbi:MAG: peptidoglycan -binding protein [Hyphomicrobiales bacterium]|nr:peptidoglycan -binding protein [Hyphomicrobiales bacterium]
MALSRTRRLRSGPDYWPGFVDALSTMLLSFVFLITVFMTAQFFLSRDVTGKDAALQKLNRQIEELTSLLALEKNAKADAQTSLSALQATLDDAKKDNAALASRLSSAEGAAAGANGQASDVAQRLAAEKELSARAAAQVDLLNQQIAALRKQLAAIEDALQASEARNSDSQARIADLGQRLNVALAQKVQELSRYRSDFFGRLRDILGNRPGVRIVGDRFVFQSEVLFDTGQATLNPAGKTQLDQVASAIIDLEREIPPEIGWVMRVDGHTDKRPIQSAQFPSNWNLSAARAIAVVQYLVTKGVDPTHLVAAGFGEYQPIDAGDSEEALRRNRRIELKLTDR